MKKYNRNKKAFSLAELLIVIAIMAIVAAIGIVQYANARRNLTVKANDSDAKLIFLAAQNQMLQMKAYGQWDALVKDHLDPDGSPAESYFGVKLTEEQKPSDYEFYRGQYNGPDWDDMVSNGDMRVISYTAQNMAQFPALFEQILPLGTVEDVVRTQGKYLIEYNVRTATVYSVFYTESEGELDYTDGAFAAAFYGADAVGRPTTEETETTARNVRRDYRDDNNARCILGYFGGGMITDVDYSALAIPEVRIDNGEELILHVKDTNSYSGEWIYPQPNPLMLSTVTITVAGKSSSLGGYNQNEVSYTLVRTQNAGVVSYVLSKPNGGGTAQLVRSFTEAADGISYEIVLDSITPGENGENRHFANNFCDLFMGSPTAGSIIPGDDIKVTVTVKPGDNSNKVTLPVSRTVETNPLFNSATVDATAGVVNAVTVSQLRHLENISSDISGVRVGSTKQKYLVVEFINSVSFDKEGEGLLPIVPKDYTDLTITNWDGSTTAFTSGSYVPVNIGTDINLEVHGNDCCVYNICIDTRESLKSGIGLFGTVGTASIDHLGIVSSRTAKEDESAKVKTVYSGRTPNMGAFFGNVRGGLAMYNCWSTVKIKAYDIASGSFGGLVGSVYKNANITNCYVSGQTEKGRFSMLPKNGNISVIAANEGGGTINAGGLIGSCNYASVENSYCSADVALGFSDKHNKTTYNFGGLAGLVNGEFYLKNGYFTGWMNIPVLLEPHTEIVNYGGYVGDAKKVFAEHSFWIEEFLGITNLPANPVNGHDGVPAADASYEELGREQTFPYDSYWYGNGYTYPEVTGLGHHWGDWCRKELPELSLFLISGLGINTINADAVPNGWGSEQINYYGNSGIRFYNVPQGAICDLDAIAEIVYKDGFEGVEYKVSGIDRIAPYDPHDPGTLPEGLTEGAFYYQMGDQSAIILVNATHLTDCALNAVDDATKVFKYEDYLVNPTTSTVYDPSITVRRFIAYALDANVLSGLEMERTMTGMRIRENDSDTFHAYAPNANYFLENISSVSNANPYSIARNHHYGTMYYKVFAFAYCDEEPGNVLYTDNVATETFDFTLTRAKVTFQYSTSTDPGSHWRLAGGTSSIVCYVEYGDSTLFADPNGTTEIVCDGTTSDLAIIPGGYASVPTVRLIDFYGNAFAFNGWKQGSSSIYPVSGGAPPQSSTNPNATYDSYSEGYTWQLTSPTANTVLTPSWTLRAMIETLDPGGGYWEVEP